MDDTSADPEPFEPTLEDAEPLARFIVRSGDFAASRVKPACFEPHNLRRDLSVYRVKSCPEGTIWFLADRYVTELRPDRKRVIARADVPLQVVRSLALRLNPNGIPHKRHLNIEDWPDKADSRRKMFMVELANAAALVIRPLPSGR